MAIRMRIKELIQEKGHREGRQITQKEVAQYSGVDESMLSRYANGFTTTFKADVIEKLMDYFNIELDDLFDRDTEVSKT